MPERGVNGFHSIGHVLLGNCLELMAGMNPSSVPLIVADPPYGIGYHSNHYVGRNPHAPVANDWNFQVAPFLHECARLLTDGGALYLFCRWDVMPLWLPAVQGTGLKAKTVIAWIKDNWSAGDLEGSFGNQYEQILFIVKGRHKLRGRRWSNVWNFPRVPATKMLHPTQKPTALIERAILASSDAGDIVLDPFAGSGSTGEACQNTGRYFTLCDVDPTMIAVAKRRLGVATDDPPKPEPVPAFLARMDPPDPAEWGIHPEEFQAVWAQITQNFAALWEVSA